VHGAGDAALGLHLPTSAPAPQRSGFCGHSSHTSRHGRGRRDRVDGDQFVEPIGDGGHGLVGVTGGEDRIFGELDMAMWGWNRPEFGLGSRCHKIRRTTPHPLRMDVCRLLGRTKQAQWCSHYVRLIQPPIAAEATSVTALQILPAALH